MIKTVRLILVFFSLLFILLPSFFPSQTFADGGAPNLAYVAGTSPGISAIDVSQQKVTTTIPLHGDPHTILLSQDGRVLYVTQPALGEVTILATKTKQVICAVSLPGHPSLLALDPGANVLYAAGNGDAHVAALDPTTCAIKHRIRTQGDVFGLAVAITGTEVAGGRGNQLWVSTATSLNIFSSTGTALATIPVPQGPEYLCIPAGGPAYVTTRLGTVEAVTLDMKHIIPHLLAGGIFGPMDYDAITGEVYVPDLQHHLLAILAPVSLETANTGPKLRRVIHVDAIPQSVAITSDGQLGFVALDNGNVVMLDIPGQQIVTTIHVGGTPHFIITGLYPTLISLTPRQSILLALLNDLAHYAGAVLIALVAILFIWRERVRAKKQDK